MNNGSDNDTLHDYYGTQRVLYGFQLYYTPLLVLLGTVGNTLSVFVFFATKLRKLSSSYYLSALAISDTGFLVALFVSWLNLVDVNLFNMPGICQLTVYLTQVQTFNTCLQSIISRLVLAWKYFNAARIFVL